MKLSIIATLAALALLFTLSTAFLDVDERKLGDLQLQSAELNLDFDLDLKGNVAVIYAREQICPLAQCEKVTECDSKCNKCETSCEKFKHCKGEKDSGCYEEEKPKTPEPVPCCEEKQKTEEEVTIQTELAFELEFEFEYFYNATYKVQDESQCKAKCSNTTNKCYKDCCEYRKEEKKQVFVEKALNVEFDLSFKVLFNATFKRQVETECKNKCKSEKKCYDDCCKQKEERVKEEYKEVLIEQRLEAEFEISFAANYEQTYKKTVEKECNNTCKSDKKCYDDCCLNKKNDLKKSYKEDWKKERRNEYESGTSDDGKKKLRYKEPAEDKKPKMKYQLEAGEKGPKMVVNDGDVEGKYSFKLTIQRVCEYVPDEVEGFQPHGGDEILNVYGAGLAELNAEANYKLSQWNFTEFEANDLSVETTSNNQLKASTRDGIFSIIFRVSSEAQTVDGDLKIDPNDLKFDFAVDVLKLKQLGWFKDKYKTELAIVATLESSMTHRICEKEKKTGAVCIEREDEVNGELALNGYVQWVNHMVCAKGASADLVIKSTTLLEDDTECDEDCKAAGAHASALSWSMDPSDVDGECLWDPVVKGHAVDDDHDIEEIEDEIEDEFNEEHDAASFAVISPLLVAVLAAAAAF